jgi:hypothetical protein
MSFLLLEGGSELIETSLPKFTIRSLTNSEKTSGIIHSPNPLIPPKPHIQQQKREGPGAEADG